MAKYLKCLIVTLGVVFTTQSYAQNFLWDIDLHTEFDNREYDSRVNWPQTLFGARLTPEIGVGWGNGNAIKAGVQVIGEFGTKSFDTDPELMFYYSYNSQKFSAYAGIFPRKNIIGGYSTAFFSDSVRFYDSNLEGVLLQYITKRGYIEFACDWNSRQTESQREKFMIFSSGRHNRKIAYGGYNFSMYHHAFKTNGSGVVDNVLINPYVGADLSRILPLDSLTIQVGWLQAFQNDRTYVGEYVTPGGAQIELRIEKYKFGIYNTLYLGKNLMPYYDFPANEHYGNGLYYGDPFYRTMSNVYNRLELFWQPIKKEHMNLKVSSVHHYDGCGWNWQQFISFTVNIGGGMFSKK